MIALLARYTPAPVKRRLRGNGKRRAPGVPRLVNYQPGQPRHRMAGVWDLDPTLRYWHLNDLERGE